MTEELDVYEYHLSRQLGMTRAELLARMGNDEYMAQMAYDEWYAAMQQREANKR